MNNNIIFESEGVQMTGVEYENSIKSICKEVSERVGDVASYFYVNRQVPKAEIEMGLRCVSCRDIPYLCRCYCVKTWLPISECPCPNCYTVLDYFYEKEDEEDVEFDEEFDEEAFSREYLEDYDDEEEEVVTKTDSALTTTSGWPICPHCRYSFIGCEC